jgi:hypothetical protein
MIIFSQGRSLMKKILLIGFLLLSIICVSQAAEYIDVLYLTDGSIIKGTIIEQVPGEEIKIKTKDGTVLVRSWNEIEKFAREKIEENSDE